MINTACSLLTFRKSSYQVLNGELMLIIVLIIRTMFFKKIRAGKVIKVLEYLFIPHFSSQKGVHVPKWVKLSRLELAGQP